MNSKKAAAQWQRSNQPFHNNKTWELWLPWQLQLATNVGMSPEMNILRPDWLV
jgi:hypothetical protein